MTTRRIEVPKKINGVRGSVKYLSKNQINKNRDSFLKEPGVAKRISSLSKSLGVSPEEILFVFEKETAGSFSPDQKNLGGGNAVGLIQFLDTDSDAGKGGKTINGNFYKHSDLEKMSALEQLDVVDEYFKENYTNKGGIPGQLYLSISSPSIVGAGPDAIAYPAGSIEANTNSGWQDSNGNVTVDALMRFGSKPEFSDWIPQPDKPYDAQKSSAGEALNLMEQIKAFDSKYKIPNIVDGDNSYFMGDSLTYKVESQLPIEKREDIKQKILEYSQNFTDKLSGKYLDSGGDSDRADNFLKGLKNELGISNLNLDDPSEYNNSQNIALYVNKLIRSDDFKSLVVENKRRKQGDNFKDMVDDRSFNLSKVWNSLGIPQLGKDHKNKKELIDKLKNNEYIKKNFRQTKRFDSNSQPSYKKEGDIDLNKIENFFTSIADKIKRDKVPLLKNTPLTPEVKKEQTILTNALKNQSTPLLLDDNLNLQEGVDSGELIDTDVEEEGEILNLDSSNVDPSNVNIKPTFADSLGDNNAEFEESFLDKIGGVSSLIGLATGVVGLGQALKDVDIPKDPKLGPAFQQRLEESKRMAQQGLTPSELAKAHKELDSSYSTGIENIVRGSAGNRAQFMAGLGGLDVARQSALMDISVADAQMQRQNQQKYDGMMMMNEQYEAARTSKYDNAKFNQDMMNKQSGAMLAGSALSMVSESIADRQLNKLRKIQTQKMMRDMGLVPDSKGNSGQDKVGIDKEGNNLLDDINSLTSEGSQKTRLIEGIKNKFNLKNKQKNNNLISLPSKDYTETPNTGLIDTRDELNKRLQESEKLLLEEENKSFMNFSNKNLPGLLGRTNY